MSRSGEEDLAQSGASSATREATLSAICDEISALLVDDVILGVCFEVHRAVKMGTFFLDEMDETSEKDYEIVDEIGLDVFGQVPMKKQLECVCPSCARNLAASRFAPHLEKCMGMGRSSSRLASRKIVIVGKEMGSDDDDNDHHSNHNDKDDDWNYNTDRKGAKKKREKSNHSPRRSKSSKLKNGEVSSAASTPSDSGRSSGNCEAMSIGSTSSKKREKKLKAAIPTVATTPTGRAKKGATAGSTPVKNKSSGRGSSGGAAASSGAGMYEVT